MVARRAAILKGFCSTLTVGNALLAASNQEIAETLVLSINTVKSHVSNIFSKLGVHTRIQAATQAHALELLSEKL